MSSASTRRLRRRKPSKRSTPDSGNNLLQNQRNARGKNGFKLRFLDHQFRIAAYVVTWVIQLGYLTWLGLRWQAQKRDAARLTRSPR